MGATIIMEKNRNKRRGIIFSIIIMFIITSFTGMLSASEEKTIEDVSLTLNVLDTVYTKPDNYAELVSWYESLEDDYPDYIEVFKANELYNTGTINGGYDDYYARITNENLGLHKPEVLFLGSPHGDETVGTIGFYWFTDWLMRMALTSEESPDYSKDWLRWLLDNREIYVEISHNPYGFDHGPQRYDGNGWDLNREADYHCCGSPVGGIWGSVQGQTLYNFVNDHQIRVGCDFHGGVRMLLYPWSSNHDNIYGTSPITSKTYSHAPPDFYYFDASSLRLGDYIGNYGGDLDEDNIGTIPDTVGYEAQGGLCPWGYGADVQTNPVEDPYVDDETFGNYPGSGILWLSPEMSVTKNPSESTFGSDNDPKYGAEVRRFVLHQTDLAQPYVRWQPGTTEDNTFIPEGTTVTFRWQVNGSMVVDSTRVQWGTNPNPMQYPQHYTTDNNDYAGSYIGGTGWENAESGQTEGVTYEETIQINDPGSYYFVAKAKVDQVYSNVLNPGEYGNNPYLRIIKERTNSSYYEQISGADGNEVIEGQIWWYSPIIHVVVGTDSIPPVTNLNVNGVMGDNGWHIGDVKVILDASDDLSGVNYTMLSLNGHDWGIYTGEFSVGEGSHSIEFYSVDYSGNVEEIKTGSFKVDYSKPYSTCDLSGSESHIVHYYAVDNAGNDEDENTCEFNIDNVDPVINLNYPVGGETLEGDIDVLWGASDDTSDPMIAISISNNDGSTWNDVASDLENNGIYGWDTTTISDGEYILRATAVDIAGNTISDISNSFMVSNGIEPPEINVDILRPETGSIYLFNNKILSLPGSFILVIGSVDIEIEAFVEGDVSDIDHVELFIDDELKENFTMEPYSWTWDEIGFGKHTIRAVAYDTYDNQAFEEITVWKIL
jgi:hypothetical protein